MKRIARLTNREKAFLSIFLGTVFGGGVTTITKVGVDSLPPLTFAFLRFLLASLIILPFFLKKKINLKKEFISLVPITSFATLNIILFILGIRFTTATIGQLLYAGVPLITGVLAYRYFNEDLKLRKLLGILIGFIGVVIIVILPMLQREQSFTGSLLGNLLITLGVISWSFYMAFSKKLQIKSSPFIVTSAFIFLTTIITFPFFLLEINTYSGWWQNLNSASIFSVFYVSIIGTILTYLLNQYAIKHGGSIFASMSFYLLPVIAFIFASIILGERLFLGVIVGGVLALLGVFLTTKK